MEPGGTAIVTGASAGIGAALAPRLAAAGWDVLLVARRAERIEALAQEIARAHGREARALALDVARDDAFAALEAACPAPAVLVNNAGAGRFGPAEATPADEQAATVRLNCEALTRLTLGYLPGMLARGRGVILNVASIAAFQPVPYFAVYAATKAYVLSLSEALDVEARARGVRVVAVCPGPVPTEFQGIAGSPDARLTPRHALRTAEQVADACVAAVRRPRPVVVPAPVHGFMRWAQRFVPRSTVLGMAAKSMKKRME